MSRSRNPYVFVGGCPRSGTTLLQRMLDQHPRLAVANDTHFVVRSLQNNSREQFAAAGRGETVQLDDALLESVWGYHRFYRIGIDRRSFEEVAAGCDTYAELVRALFDWYATQQGKELAGEKTPDYVRHAEALLKMFPESRFVTLVRDGRDVALSLLDWAQPKKGPGRLAWWDQDPVATAALWWNDFAAATIERDQRALTIQYENLIAQVQGTLERVCGFLQLEYDRAICLPTRRGMRDWRRDLAPEDVAVFEQLAGGQLERFGYALARPQTTAEVKRRVEEARAWWDRGATRRSTSQNRTSIVADPTQRSLLSEDQAIVRREHDLPGLRTIISDDHLNRWLRSNQLENGGVSTNYVRYKPRTSYLAGLQDSRGRPWGYVIAYDASSGDKIAKRMQGRANAVHVDRELHLVAFRFPHDRDLPQLASCCEEDELKRTLQAADDGRLAACDFDSLSTDVMSYKPQRRCVLRVSCDDNPIAALRLFTHDRYRRAAVANKQMADYGMDVVRPNRLGHSDRFHLILTSWLDGRSLTLEDPPTLHEQAGAQLAALHAFPHAKLPITTRDDILGWVRAAKHSLCDVLPAASGLVSEVYRFLCCELNGAATRLTLVHGDYHPGQILCHESRLGIVDWDNASNAMPELDIGNYIAHLYLEGTAKGWGESEVEGRIASFLTEYRQASDLQSAAIDAHVAFALLRVAIQPFRRRWANWPQAIDRLLEIAARYVANGRATKTTGAAPPSQALRDSSQRLRRRVDADASFADRVASVTSSDFAIQDVGPIVAKAFSLADDDVELHSVNVCREVHNRRCLIEYGFESRQADRTGRRYRALGKMRHKGFDLYAYDVQRRLHTHFETNRNVNFAACLGAIPEQHLWLQSRVDGASADQVITPTSDLATTERIAAALAELHRADIPAGRTYSLTDESRILGEGLGILADRKPRWAPRLQEIRDASEALLAEIEDPFVTGIHRDFYPAQVVVHGRKITFVDNDLFARGPALIDVGNYVAHLREQALRQFRDFDSLMRHERAFVEAYQSHLPEVDSRSIKIATLVALARHIYISHRIKERRPQRQTLIELCLRLLRVPTLAQHMS